MNRLCKQYISQVKLLLPTIGKSEKNCLTTLTSNLEDFCEDTSPQTMDDLYKEFGSPVDTVNSYISTLPTETLIKRIRTSKYIRCLIVAHTFVFCQLTDIIVDGCHTTDKALFANQIIDFLNGIHCSIR